MIGSCSCIESLTDKTPNEEGSEWKQARAKQAKKRHCIKLSNEDFVRNIVGYAEPFKRRYESI